MTTTICHPDLSARPFALTVKRRMALPPDALFLAFGEHFDRWFAAPGTLLLRGEVDTPFFFETHFHGTRFPHYGRFLRREPAQLVELTWLTVATKGAETVLTVAFAPHEDGADLLLTHAGFPDAQSRDAHETAWPDVLASLDQQLAGRA